MKAVSCIMQLCCFVHWHFWKSTAIVVVMKEGDACKEQGQEAAAVHGIMAAGDGL